MTDMRHHEETKFWQPIKLANLTRETNGALLITGTPPVLKAVRDFVEKFCRIYLTLDLSHKIDGVEQLAGPFIRVHPQVAEVVYDVLYDVVLRETPDDRAHRLYQQHGADTLTKAKKLLREAQALVGTPDALDLLASVQREAVESYNDEDVKRVATERHDAIVKFAGRLR